MNKHTPGQWTVNAYNEIESGAVRICSVDIEETNAGLNGGEGQANARLIAAAPDLLEALKYCAAVCAGEVMNKNGLINALEKARAAIAKATEAA